MAFSPCKSTVIRIYQDIIEDVIQNVSELFVEDGVDEHVLQDLKQTWESKLKTNQAVKNKENSNVSNSPKGVSESEDQKPKQVVRNSVPPQTQNQQIHLNGNEMIPIQITLPGQNGINTNSILKVQVPAVALQNNQLQKVLSGSVLTTIMTLPQVVASSVLQQHINAAFSIQTANANEHSGLNVTQNNGTS